MANNHKRRRRRIFWVGGSLLVLGAAALGVSALRPTTTIDPSKLAKVERGDIAKSVVATGKIEPLTKVQVKSKASGIVKELFVDYGDHVKKGQVLVELDKETALAAVRQAKASLLSAQAALERTKVDAEGPDLPYLKSAAERARKLFHDGLLAPSALDDAEKAYELGVNKQKSAKGNVAVNKAEVARAQAQLDSAETDLRYSTILSPMDGLVLSRDVEVGDAVSSILVLGSQATLLMTLGDVSSVYVLGKVDEADIGKVYLNQPARIVVESFKDKKFTGAVTKISPLGVIKDNVTTFEVRVSIQNPTGELKANMSANAEIILKEQKDALLVPEAAIVYDKDKKPFVEVPDPGQKNGRRRVAVTLGISNGIKAEVVKGVEQGEQVVLQ
jgi:HlyD family secretion protein